MSNIQPLRVRASARRCWMSGATHDHQVVDARGPAVGGEAAAGGDVDRAPDAVEGDAVGGSQGLDAADPGDHLDGEGH